MVVQGYNPARMRLSQDDCELYNSLGRKGRWVLKVKLDLCNPNLPVARPQVTAWGRQVLCPVRMVGKLAQMEGWQTLRTKSGHVHVSRVYVLSDLNFSC